MATRSARQGKVQVSEGQKTKFEVSEKEEVTLENKDQTDDLELLEEEFEDDEDEDEDLLNESELYDPDTKGATGLDGKDGSLYEPNLDDEEMNKKLRLLPEDEVSEEKILEELSKLIECDDDKKDDDEVKESITNLFEGQELSEEFKTKVGTIFEAAVNLKVKTRMESLKQKAVAIIKEHRSKSREQLAEGCERMMNHFANTWFTENRISVIDGVTAELAEGAIKTMKGFLSKYNVRVPRSRENLVEKLSLDNAKIRKQLDEQLGANIKLQERLDKIAKRSHIRTVAEGLSDTDKEKFVALAEEVNFKDEKSYRTKLVSIKEGLFTAKTVKTQADDFASRMLMEKKEPENKPETSKTGGGSAYLSLL